MGLLQISEEGVRRAAKEAELVRAAGHLAKSEKGRDAMRRVVDWLDESGCSLDPWNQRAILKLLEAAWGGWAGTARDVMHEALGDCS